MATKTPDLTDASILDGNLIPSDLGGLGGEPEELAAKTKKKKCNPPPPDDDGGGGGGKKGNEKSIKGPICDLKD